MDMKKKSRAFALFSFIGILLLSCNDSNDESNDSHQAQQEDIQSKIDGVWANGDYFISFNKSEGYMSACISNDYIDNGNYSITGNKVLVSNSFFNVKNVYEIEAVTSQSISVKISYTDVWGKIQSKTVYLKKTGEYSTERYNYWYGKTITRYSDTFGTIKYDFYSFYTGKKSCTKGSAAKYPVSYYYVTREEKIYMMDTEQHQIQVPSIGAWNGTENKVKVVTLVETPGSSTFTTRYL